MQTTIIFEESLPGIRRRKFKDVYDFLTYWEENAIGVLREVPDEEITPELRKKMEEAYKKPLSDFIQI